MTVVILDQGLINVGRPIVASANGPDGIFIVNIYAIQVGVAWGVRIEIVQMHAIWAVYSAKKRATVGVAACITHCISTTARRCYPIENPTVWHRLIRPYGAVQVLDSIADYPYIVIRAHRSCGNC